MEQAWYDYKQQQAQFAHSILRDQFDLELCQFIGLFTSFVQNYEERKSKQKRKLTLTRSDKRVTRKIGDDLLIPGRPRVRCGSSPRPQRPNFILDGETTSSSESYTSTISTSLPTSPISPKRTVHTTGVFQNSPDPVRNTKLNHLFSISDMNSFSEIKVETLKEFEIDLSSSYRYEEPLPPVLFLQSGTSSLTITTDEDKALIKVILPESHGIPKGFMFDHVASCYTDDFLNDPGHLNWAGIKLSSESKRPAYFIVSVAARGNTIYFLESKSTGYNSWSRSVTKATQGLFIRKSGGLNPRKVEKAIIEHYGDGFCFHKLPTTKSSMDGLRDIDVTRRNVIIQFTIGVLYRTHGQKKRKAIFGNASPSGNFWRFIDDMGVTIPSPSDKGGTFTHWHGKKYMWALAPLMDYDEQRKAVGNCMAVLIYNDSEEPLDISALNLGEATNFICVVQRHQDKYRLGCAFHYKVPVKDGTSEEWESKIKTMSVLPDTPTHFLFCANSLREFLLVKIHNAVMLAARCHPGVKKICEMPVQAKLDGVVEKHLPDWVLSCSHKKL
eukprot:TRINITY_DN5513_c0_g1_i1.p1 TRINITY_DN5513_c0_g1~~TRINITY_DN5513_c0_g1_i1.p1  ORF type:complete len:579 (+),score=87.17 TRINITY_DN5513_c0_g1_i1:77-1738(+)